MYTNSSYVGITGKNPWKTMSESHQETDANSRIRVMAPAVAFLDAHAVATRLKSACTATHPFFTCAIDTDKV